jgi:D-alanyl-D-alanine carboxypeptidase
MLALDSMLGFNGLQKGCGAAAKFASGRVGITACKPAPHVVWWDGRKLEVMLGRLMVCAGLIASGFGRLRLLAVLGLVLGLALVAGPVAAARYTAIVVDAKSGKVLFSRNADRRHYPASLTKMMTLYLTFEGLEKGTLKLHARLKVSRRAAGQTPSKLGLKRGQTISVEDAILALVTKSANDAATVLAEALGGKESRFAGQMTEKAKLLGMRRTRFRNATGLPNRHQRSTARDMATLALALQRDFPQYYHYFSTRKFRYKNRTFTNHNQLLHSYKGADGLKTGYIRASGFNVAVSAQRGKRRLIGVVMGGRSPKWRDRKTARLMDMAFRRAQVLDMAGHRKAGKRKLAKLKPLRQRAAVRANSRKANKQNLARRLLARLDGIGVRPSRPGKEADRESAKQSTAVANGATNGAADSLSKNHMLPEKPLAASPTAPANGWWGIQVGAYKGYGKAWLRADRASRMLPYRLRHARISIALGTTRAIYRAQLIGLSQGDAGEACRLLKRRGLGCVTLPPDNGKILEVAQR